MNEYLLKLYSEFLEQNGYLDSDWREEKPTAIERFMKENKIDDEPYFGWCDVEGCEKEGCSGGNAWRETGYWTVCTKHADDCRKGQPQPKMKQKAIERENSRDKTTGYLPSVK
jgi:hypothetical protein